MQDVKVVGNHEVWIKCGVCGEEFDARLKDRCPCCGCVVGN